MFVRCAVGDFRANNEITLTNLIRVIGKFVSILIQLNQNSSSSKLGGCEFLSNGVKAIRKLIH